MLFTLLTLVTLVNNWLVNGASTGHTHTHTHLRSSNWRGYVCTYARDLTVRAKTVRVDLPQTRISVSSLWSPSLGPTFWSIITIIPKAVVVVSIVDLSTARPLAHSKTLALVAGLANDSVTAKRAWRRAPFILKPSGLEIKVRNISGAKGYAGDQTHFRRPSRFLKHAT